MWWLRSVICPELGDWGRNDCYEFKTQGDPGQPGARDRLKKNKKEKTNITFLHSTFFKSTRKHSQVHYSSLHSTGSRKVVSLFVLLLREPRHKWNKKMSTKERNLTLQPPNHCPISQTDHSSQAPWRGQSPFLWVCSSRTYGQKIS